MILIIHYCFVTHNLKNILVMFFLRPENVHMTFGVYFSDELKLPHGTT